MNSFKLTLSLASKHFAGPYGVDDSYSYSDTPLKSPYDIPGNYHKGMFSQPKKLRKGAGHKKLTRAQGKRGY